MTTYPGIQGEPPKLVTWRERQGWLNSPVFDQAADVLAIMTAASLPWSTTAPAIFIALFLLMMVPTLDWRAYARHLAHPACALSFMLVALAIVGVLWSDAPWPARLHGISPTLKLLLIPALLYHFQHSSRGMSVFIAFLVSCTLLMVLSWILLVAPGLKISATVSDGVPVKNYIDQSQEFTFCAFALALPALVLWQRRQMAASAGCLALIAAFIANMMFVASARTALLCMLVLLALFASLHLSRHAMLKLFAAAAVAGALIWTTSPYLRRRIMDIAVEYRASDLSAPASTAQRLNYWRKSIRFILAAPLLGHGTGSIKQLFEQDAIGESGLRAEVVNNPHNQALNVVIQWGIVGGIILYAMWFSHLMLFASGHQEAWIGVIIVVQNVISSLFNSHLFDFHEGWMYVLGVGVAGGLAQRAARKPRRDRPLRALMDQATSAVSSTSSPTAVIEWRDNSSRNLSKGSGGATR
jgi:O-antigen ligase